MKKTMKRILAFVLTFLMCASLAAPVFAADDAACPGVGAIHEKANCDATKIGEHVPTCGEQGYTVYKCNGCGTYFADDIYESDKEHVWVEGSYDETCEKDGYKGLVCEVCDSKHPNGVTIDEFDGHNVVFEEDSCEFKGQTITGKCTRCDYTETKVVTGEHIWTTVPEILKAPTCAADGQGLAQYMCTVCRSKKQVVIYATEHNNLQAVAAVEADCKTNTKGNTAGQKCLDCGWTNVTETNPTHSFGDTPNHTEVANCTQWGGEFYLCRDCGYADIRNKVAPYNHDYIDVNKNGKYDAGTDTNLKVVDEDVKATCQAAGVYKWHCSLCNTAFDESDSRPKYEEHDLEEVVVKPTCNSTGYTYDKCKREGCDVDAATAGAQAYTSAHRDAKPVDPNTHTIDEARTVSTPATCLEPGLKTEYCANCSYYKQTPEAALGHDYDANNDGVNDGVVTAPLCGVDGYTTFTCNRAGCDVDAATAGAQPHSYKVAGEKFDVTNYKHHGHNDATAVLATGAQYPQREGSCSIIGIKTYKCPTCTAANGGVDVTYSIIEEGTGSHSWKVVAALKVPAFCGDTGALKKEECERCHITRGGETLGTSTTAHNFVTTVAPVAPTCQADGNTEGKKCDCTFNVVYTQASGANSTTVFAAGEIYKEGVQCNAKVLSAPIEKLAHRIIIPDSRAMDCEEFGYIHYECAMCGNGYIDSFVAAREHDYVKNDVLSKAPECEADGYDYFVCSHNATHTKTEKVSKTYHKDAEGNAIKCIEEDFYCAVCAPEAAGVKLDADRSHYHVITRVPATCQKWAYDLYVCELCEEFHEEYDFEGNNFVFGEHEFVNYIADPNRLATYAAPGVEVSKCTYCNVYDERAYVLTDVKFDAVVENGVVADANIVNSGLVALKINVSAYKVDVWGVQLKVGFDTSALKFVEVKADNEVFEKTVAANAVGNEVLVGLYVQNKATPADEMQNTTLNGVEADFITLYFEVKDTVADGYVFDFAFVAPAHVIDKDENTVEANITADIEEAKVYMLGDVNADDVITIKDAAAAMSYVTFETEGYEAEADIDKDGKITATDFAYIMQHITGKITYAQLAAK